jgi:hypothetical protein
VIQEAVTNARAVMMADSGAVIAVLSVMTGNHRMTVVQRPTGRAGTMKGQNQGNLLTTSHYLNRPGNEIAVKNKNPYKIK